MNYLQNFAAASLAVALASSAQAQFTQLTGPCDFGAVQVVGESPWVAGPSTRLGFDLLPDGSPLTTPNALGNGLFTSAPIAAAFQSVGVLLDADDVAVAQPSNPGGTGTKSLPNSLGGDATGGFFQPIEFRFVDPASGASTTVPAAGMWIADGPTNDVTVTFFDANGATIAAIPPGPVIAFIGIASPIGIARILLTASAADDYYIDDLYYGTAPFAGGLTATETTRLGTPANPAALLPGQTSGPVVGETWDPVVDHTTFLPGAIFDVFALGAVPANLPFANWGTILCDQLAGTLANPAGVPFAIPIPNNCSLMGLSLCAQILATDGPTLALTNALDITIGNL